MGATGRPHRLLDSTNSGKNHPIGLVEQQDYSRNQRFSDTSEKEYAENAVLIGLRMTF
jgi:hypothetical protein